jgi:hypothetical protein
VLVLEGRERVGGKVLTFSRRVEGYPEAGGNMIYGGYRRIMDRARSSRGGRSRTRLPRLGKHADFALILDGRPVSKAQWRDSPRNPFPSSMREMMPWQYVPRVTHEANPLHEARRLVCAGATRRSTYRCTISSTAMARRTT